MSVPDGPFASLAREPGLPAAFRTQFLGRGAVLEGTMDRVWRRGIFAAVAAHLGLLLRDTGTDVPVRLEIETEGRRQVWRRTVAFPKERRLDTVTALDDRLGLHDRTGPGGWIRVPWTWRFDAPDTLVLESQSAYLGRLRLPFAPRARIVQRAVAEDGIEIDFAMSRPDFGYSGRFTVRPR